MSAAEPVVRLVEVVEETRGHGLDRFAIPELWRFSRGAGVRVGIFDSGVDEAHEDLSGAVHGRVNFTPDPDADSYGHGTHCAGIVGARVNGLGVHGVAPECDLFSVKVINDQGGSMYPWLIQGLDWAIAHRLDVASVSITGDRDDPLLHDAIRRAHAAGIVVVAAAGNAGFVAGVDTSGYPARYPETIGVGAVGTGDARAHFSSSGGGVNIMAPGTDILSTLPGNRYGITRGTSTATPFVAGVVALVLGKLRSDGGNATPRLLQELLYENAGDLGTPGVDKFTGYGLIKPESLFAAIQRRFAAFFHAPPQSTDTALRLGAVPLFAGLPPERLEEIAAACQTDRREAGEVIFREGDRAGRLYLVLEGMISVQKATTSGAVELARILPPGCLGELSLFDGAPRSASAIALEPCRFLTLSGEALRPIARAHPEIYENFLTIVSRRLRQAGAKLAG
ncbi:MAG: S8 family serine peptidase [Deltaproteobacteria bacterium]|nr:S8 family serine peptidase [Deltaproteobacteria bacterium]